MAVYASPSADENPAYHANGEYDAGIIKAFFDKLTDVFAPQSYNGGDTDRLSASAVIGRNSVSIRMTPRDDLIITDDLPAASVLSATLESESEDQRDIEMRFEQGGEETRTEATERWVETFRDAVIAAGHELRLPITIPLATPAATTTGTAPAFLAPQDWVAE